MSCWAQKTSWHQHKHDDSHYTWGLAAQGTHCFLLFLRCLCKKSSMISEVKAGDKQTLRKKKTFPNQSSCWAHKPKPILLSASAAKPRVCLSLLCSLQWLYREANPNLLNENWEKYEKKKSSFFYNFDEISTIKKYFFPLPNTITIYCNHWKGKDKK